VQTRNRKKEKRNVLVGLEEDALRYYGASLVLVFEYLHSKGIVYRDLKPENVLVDKKGFVKLGDFGFAKNLGHAHGKTYTFCGTPGYVAPENVLASGYGTSVDWWGLGVLLYVMRTGRQPFNYPKTDDPVVVMKRIVDPKWDVGFPPYVSAEMKDLILQLLVRDPNDRLGHGQHGVRDIKEHPFFNGFDWETLSCGRAEPPAGLKPPPRRQEGEEEDPMEASFSNETDEEKFEAKAAFEDF
jgi:cGMP-dependent protein kinase 2